ncbi:MAG: hypothetical protein JW839_01730 [Candidatus Lokiarchaeota archaeon]|nr:hypothetical protein [Candidatus Lokiarchaeota archaeon]
MERKGLALSAAVLLMVTFATLCCFLPNTRTCEKDRYVGVRGSAPESLVICTQDGQSITVNDQLLFQNAKVDFGYVPAGNTSARSFAASATLESLTNSSFSDGRGTGVRYILAYNNTDAMLVEEIRIYPSLGAVLLNASLFPKTDLSFSGGRFELITCAKSDVLPFMDPGNKWLSYFEGLDIWGNFAVKLVRDADVDFTRTPALIHDASTGLLVGAVTSELLETEVMLHGSSFAVKMPIVDGYQAYNQTAISLETCWIQFGSNFSDLFMSYAEQVRSFNPPVRARTVDNFFNASAGACDWYNRYGNIDENTVSDDLDRTISLKEGGYGFYIIDSGWCYEGTTGQDYNWSTWNVEKFPSGVDAIATKAHAAGYKLLLWNRIGWAPVWIQVEHPEWVRCWGGWGYVQMNLSMPEVQAYMADVFATWAAQGIDGIKVDFITDTIYQDAWNASLWNADKTRAERAIQYFDLLDQYASTYNLPVLLCGTPIGLPSLAKYPNLVASRVTCDSGYQGIFTDWQIKTALLRSFWWGAAFNTPDPDAFDTKDLRSVMVASACGGAVYYGDNYTGLNVYNAKLAWTLRWDAPALPENVAFMGKDIIARGTWRGRPAAIGVNLDGPGTQYIIGGLGNSTSVIRLSVPVVGIFGGTTCYADGISGHYDLHLEPKHAVMLIFYQGQPPIPAQSCMETELLTVVIGLAIPVALMGVTIVYNLRKKTKR